MSSEFSEFIVIVMCVTFLFLVLKNYVDEKRRENKYLNTLFGYKIGYVEKMAEEDGITIYSFDENSKNFPKINFKEKLKNEVENDLNSI